MPIAAFIILVPVAYLLGAIPFGLLIGRVRGIDVRLHGSKNIGATNVGRVVGRRWGYLCLLLDISKGFGPTYATSLFVDQANLTPLALTQWLLIAIAAVLGHMFPLYLRFRGGKGVATTIGVGLGVYPYFTLPMLVAVVFYLVARFATGLVSLGSLLIAIVFPLAFAVFVWLSAEMTIAVFWPLQSVAALLGLLIVVKHRSNIARLLRGQESRIGDTESHDPQPAEEDDPLPEPLPDPPAS